MMGINYNSIQRFTSNSMTFTVPSGAPSLLIGFVGDIGADHLTTCTVGGVAATLVGKVLSSGFNARYTYLYSFSAPTPGAVSIATTWSGGGSISDGFVISYVGVIYPSSFGTGVTGSTGGSGTTLGISVTTGVSNSWVVGFFSSSNGNSIVAGSGATARSNVATCTFLDSGALSSTGAFSLNAALDAGTSGMAGIAVEVKPFVLTVDTTSISAAYKLDESSGDAADSSGNGYTAVNTSVTYAAGKINNGAVFNGSAYFTAPQNAINNTTISISFWLKKNGNFGGNGEALFSKGTSSPAYGFVLFGVGAGGQIGIQARDSGGTVQLNISTSGASIVDNAWHHVVLVLVGGGAANSTKIYIDGVENVSGTCGSFSYTSNSTSIGTSEDTFWSKLTGSMDSINIWNKALTANDVANLYYSGAGLDYPFVLPSAVATRRALLGVGI